MVSGPILLSPKIEISIFHYFQILNQKAKWQKKYDVYRNQDGISERALFVIDSDGIIRWSYVTPIGINPGAEGILKALESIAVSEPKNVENMTEENVSGK